MTASRGEVFYIESSAVQTARTHAREARAPHYVLPIRYRGRPAFTVSTSHGPPPYTKVHPDGRAVIHTASRLDPAWPPRHPKTRLHGKFTGYASIGGKVWRVEGGKKVRVVKTSARQDPARRGGVAHTIEATRALRGKVEPKFLPLFDHLLGLAASSLQHGDPQGAGRELRAARKLAGEHKALRPAAKSRRIRREYLGAIMQHWHSSGGDPIYAVGSYYYGGHPYPVTGYAGPHKDGPSVVRAALESIESYIPRAERGEHGWTKRDAGQLRTIAAGLRYYLKHDYPAGSVAADPRRRHDPSRTGVPMFRPRQYATMTVTVEHKDGRVEFKDWRGSSAKSIKAAAKERYPGARLRFGAVMWHVR